MNPFFHLKAFSWNGIMEDDIVEYANTLSTEHKNRFIEYLKLWSSKDMEEYVAKRKKIGAKNVTEIKVSFQNFLMRVLPIEGALMKLQSDSQSHST
jgi:hypothetical protein